MTSKQILRLAYGVVALALLAWAGIGWAVWSAWRSHREELETIKSAAATTVATTPLVPTPVEAFDRTQSSVQYGPTDGAGNAVDVPDWLLRTIEDMPEGEQSIGGWIGHLRKQGVAACWRMAPPNPREPDVVFAMPFEKGSVREILDELCRRNPRYHWEWMKGSEVVNVLADTRLDAPLGDVSFRPKRLYYCLADLQSAAYVYTTYPFDQPRNYQSLLYWPVTIKAKQITVRDYLNLAVAQYEGMTWTVNFQGVLEFEAPETTRAKVIENHRDVVEAEREQ